MAGVALEDMVAGIKNNSRKCRVYLVNGETYDLYVFEKGQETVLHPPGYGSPRRAVYVRGYIITNVFVDAVRVGYFEGYADKDELDKGYFWRLKGTVKGEFIIPYSAIVKIEYLK